MTMPEGSTEEPDVTVVGRESIPVHVVSTDAKPQKALAPEFARFHTYLVTSAVGMTSTTPGAQRILNRSLRRYEARIIVNATTAAQPIPDGVIIGGRDEINSGRPAAVGDMGGYLQIGDSMTYKGQGELWVAFPVGNTAAVFVTVLDMQYASDPESWREDPE